ncbi:hypothetical protein PG997_005345 [Apiospora hydei]|uniref:Uncharacterized protein n=1 Tax=Apiospora hydei TaxID=1337664 RepID=A0ABR1X4Q4_9PEZI
MSDEDTSGGEGPSGQPADKKRPRDSPVKTEDSAKKPKTSFGPAWSPSLPPTPRPSFGSPALMGTTTSFPFGTGTNFPQPNASLQVNPETPGTASQTLIQVDAQQWEKTNSDVRDLIKEVSELKKRLDESEKPASSNKTARTPTYPHKNLIYAENYLAWLQKLDLRPPEGIINWKKGIVAFTAAKLVDFGHLELVLVTQSCLRSPPRVRAHQDIGWSAARDLDFFQEVYHNTIVELTTTGHDPIPPNLPKYPLPLGEIFEKRYDLNNEFETTETSNLEL